MQKIAEKVMQLDFSLIRMKLQMPHPEGQGWTQSEVEEVELEYKKFLTMQLDHDECNFDLVPDRSVDVFWHAHIIDTAKYAKDCHLVFGEFLNHYPYFGLKGPEDKAVFEEAWKKTDQHYRKKFGQPPKKYWSSTDPSGGGSAACGRTGCAPGPPGGNQGGSGK